MEFLLSLWLPILLTGVALFFMSSLFWTVLPHHQNDFDKIASEDELMDAVRNIGIPTGMYMFPMMKHADMKDPEMREKYAAGPRGTLVLWDLPNMGRNLGLTLTYFLVISLVLAYVSWAAIGGQEGVDFRKVFQVTGAIAALVFCASGQLNAIWFPRRTLMDFVDGIAYGVVTGLIFASLWPY